MGCPASWSCESMWIRSLGRTSNRAFGLYEGTLGCSARDIPTTADRARASRVRAAAAQRQLGRFIPRPIAAPAPAFLSHAHATRSRHRHAGRRATGLLTSAPPRSCRRPCRCAVPDVGPRAAIASRLDVAVERNRRRKCLIALWFSPCLPPGKKPSCRRLAGPMPANKEHR